MGRLDALVAVVTGAGSGIGRESALEFAREGARVVVADVRPDAARETVHQIEREGGDAEPIQVDVTSYEQVQAMLRTAQERFGKLDVLFNNAGVPQANAPCEQTSDEVFERIFDVNVKGVFYGCRAAIPLLKANGGGVILNTASTAGIRPRPGLAAYSASKAAVINLTKTLALELAPHRIRVVSLCPVATDTPMLRSFLGADEDQARERFIASIPWGRLNRPVDLARAAAFLVSPDAEMVTGTAFEVDGGRDI